MSVKLKEKVEVQTIKSIGFDLVKKIAFIKGNDQTDGYVSGVTDLIDGIEEFVASEEEGLPFILDSYDNVPEDNK